MLLINIFLKKSPNQAITLKRFCIHIFKEKEGSEMNAEMLCFEELEQVEELGDGAYVAGFCVGVGIIGICVYAGIAT